MLTKTFFRIVPCEEVTFDEVLTEAIAEPANYVIQHDYYL
jgi:hypothetical protein